MLNPDEANPVDLCVEVMDVFFKVLPWWHIQSIHVLFANVLYKLLSLIELKYIVYVPPVTFNHVSGKFGFN